MTKEKLESMRQEHPEQDVPPSSEPIRVLLAEDDKEMRSLLADALRQDGFLVTPCSNGGDLLYCLRNYIRNLEFGQSDTDFDLIVSDIRMPFVTGLEILEGMHRKADFPPMILITAFGDKETHDSARRFGAAAIFDKPFELEDLMAKVHELGARK